MSVNPSRSAFLQKIRLKISVLMDILVLEIYGFIGHIKDISRYISGYFYININNIKINKNNLKFLKIPYKSLNMT